MGVVLWGISRSQAAKEAEDEEDGHHNDGQLAEDRLASAKLSPLAASLTGITFESLVAELVVDHATESDGVTEELKGRHLGAPDDHGGNNKHDILENTAKGEDNSGSLANLCI